MEAHGRTNNYYVFFSFKFIGCLSAVTLFIFLTMHLPINNQFKALLTPLFLDKSDHAILYVRVGGVGRCLSWPCFHCRVLELRRALEIFPLP